MAKVTRLFAVVAFVLGIGLVVARDASANHGGPHDDQNTLANVVAQVNAADVTQVNNVEQNAAQVAVAAQVADCTTNRRNSDCNINQNQNVDVDQEIDQEIDDVDQANAALVDQNNDARNVDQRNRQRNRDND